MQSRIGYGMVDAYLRLGQRQRMEMDIPAGPGPYGLHHHNKRQTSLQSRYFGGFARPKGHKWKYSRLVLECPGHAPVRHNNGNFY